MYGHGCVYCNSRWLLPWCFIKAFYLAGVNNWGQVDIVPMYRLAVLFQKQTNPEDVA